MQPRCQHCKITTHVSNYAVDVLVRFCLYDTVAIAHWEMCVAAVELICILDMCVCCSYAPPEKPPKVSRRTSLSTDYSFAVTDNDAMPPPPPSVTSQVPIIAMRTLNML